MLRILERLGDLSVFNAFYAAALVGIVLDTSAIPWAPTLIVGALLNAHATFLLDRVKVRPSLLDPADAEARGERHALLLTFGPWLRGLVLLETVAAIVLLGRVAPVLGLLPILSLAGVMVYAGAPKKFSLKSSAWSKTTATSLSLAGWAGVLTWGGGASPVIAMTSSIVLVGMVAADAVLCDLPDLESDRRHGVSSAAVTMGKRDTLRLAFALMIVALLLAVLAVTNDLAGVSLARHLGAQTAVGALVIGVAMALSSTRLLWLRDVVDLRLPVGALFIHLTLG